MVSDTFDGLYGKCGFPAGTLVLGAWTKIFGLGDLPSTLNVIIIVGGVINVLTASAPIPPNRKTAIARATEGQLQ